MAKGRQPPGSGNGPKEATSPKTFSPGRTAFANWAASGWTCAGSLQRFTLCSRPTLTWPYSTAGRPSTHRPNTSIKSVRHLKAQYFADAVPTFVTERQALRGGLKRFQLIVIPQAVHVPDDVFEAFQQYLASGGVLMTTGPVFVHDEYGRPRDKTLKAGARTYRGLSRVTPTTGLPRNSG